MFDAFVQNASVLQCLMIGVTAGGLFLSLARQLVEGLFRVGRSETEVSALKDKYSVPEQFLLEHIFKDSMYEDDFARCMAIFHDLGAALLWAMVLLILPALLLDQLRMVMAWMAILLTLVCLIPMLTLHLIFLKIF